MQSIYDARNSLIDYLGVALRFGLGISATSSSEDDDESTTCAAGFLVLVFGRSRFSVRKYTLKWWLNWALRWDGLTLPGISKEACQLEKENNNKDNNNKDNINNKDNENKDNENNDKNNENNNNNNNNNNNRIERKSLSSSRNRLMNQSINQSTNQNCTFTSSCFFVFVCLSLYLRSRFPWIRLLSSFHDPSWFLRLIFQENVQVYNCDQDCCHWIY